MSTEDSAPESAPALLAALQAHAPPLAMVSATGRVSWCTATFEALFGVVPTAGVALSGLLGAAAADLLAAGTAPLQAASGPWLLRSVPVAGGWLLSADSVAEQSELRERLDLVQELTCSGVFERDPRTLEGRWDRRMFEILGFPPDPQGRAPDYADVLRVMHPEDTRQGAFGETLRRPGPHRQRVRVRRPDGQVRYVNTQWKVLFDAQGEAQRVIGINTDDTDAFLVHLKSAQLSAELDVALQVSGIGLWRVDFALDRVMVDRRSAEIMGLPHDPLGVARDLALERVHVDDRALVEASAQETLRSGEPSDMLLRYATPEGGWRLVQVRRALQRSPDGRPMGFVGVMMDVNERAEEGRRSREIARRLEAAAESARVGLWSVASSTALPSWNPLMFELFGLDPADGTLPLAQWLARCVHPDDLNRVRRETQTWWQRPPGAYEIEFRIVRPSDGATRSLAVRGRVELADDKAERRAEGVALDITEQQTMMRQLRETVERISLTTAALGLGTWSSDIAREHVHWDAQMFRLRGIDSPGRQVGVAERRACVHSEDREAVIAAQNACVRDGEAWHDDFRVLWPDGQVRWITSHSVPLRDERGNIERRIGVNWDSTDLHNAGDALRERERAVAESRAKSQAISRISHELRTPLNAILGFTQLLRGGAEGSDGQRRAQWLAHVEDAAQHLLALIDGVLELSSAQAEAIKLNPVPVACAEAVAAAMTLVAGIAERQQVSLHSVAVAGVVLADPVRLRQVLINLLSNAIKYNRPGGEVHVTAEAEHGFVWLHVEDNGIGIAPERLRDAFEPFNRLGAETTAVEGSGIGLAIVKVLVEQMGGQVQLRSDPGRGSRFSVALPAAADGVLPAPLTAAAPWPAAAVAAPLQLLYIEDNPVNALLVREILRQRPHVQLHVAETGASGIQAALDLRPALILVDMQLPDMDGRAVLRALRAEPRTATIRCVALTADVGGDADADGFADWWTKPIDLRRLLEGIDRFLAP